MTLIAFEILWAVVALGLPVTVMTWYLVNRLYQSGKITTGSDRESVKESFRQAKKDWKENKKQSTDFLEQRWLRFGGGFYGITALVTFLLIETREIAGFIFNFPGFAELFKDGVVSLLVDIFVGQIQNFVSAMVWFTYWADTRQLMWVWAVVAYAAYWLGLSVATKSLEELLSDWNEMLDKLRR